MLTDHLRHAETNFCMGQSHTSSSHPADVTYETPINVSQSALTRTACLVSYPEGSCYLEMCRRKCRTTMMNMFIFFSFHFYFHFYFYFLWRFIHFSLLVCMGQALPCHISLSWIQSKQWKNYFCLVKKNRDEKLCMK